MGIYEEERMNKHVEIRNNGDRLVARGGGGKDSQTWLLILLDAGKQNIK